MSQNKNDQQALVIAIDILDSKKEKRDKEQIQKKLQKIETLKANLLKIEKKIKNIKIFFNDIVLPEQERLFAHKEAFIEKLFVRFKQKSFSENQKYLISDLLEEEIQNLNEEGYNSKRTQDILNELFLLKTNDIDKEEEDLLNEMTKEMLRNLGVDVDDEEFDFRNMNNPDFIEQARRSFYENEKNTDQEIEEKTKRNKTQNTDKDFYKIYKSLVKKAHPDLVTDPQEKEQREAWMKELSQIWSDRNYIQLLVMEKEITGTNNSEITLSNLQTKPLIKQLNEQIRSLDVEKYTLTTANPETAFYFQNFKGNTEKTVLKKIKEYKNGISEEIEKTHYEIGLIKTQKSTKEFLSILNDTYISSNPFDNFFFE